MTQCWADEAKFIQEYTSLDGSDPPPSLHASLRPRWIDWSL